MSGCGPGRSIILSGWHKIESIKTHNAVSISKLWSLNIVRALRVSRELRTTSFWGQTLGSHGSSFRKLGVVGSPGFPKPLAVSENLVS